MENVESSSPLLLKYLTDYNNNPNSRVFAPLAETYRKLGNVEKALSILKEGIKKHPTYISGYLCLASCYLDLEKYELAHATLRPFVSDNLENLLLLKVFGVSCEKLMYLDEALETYKYLLFLNPKDVYYQRKIKELEGQEKIFSPIQTDNSKNKVAKFQIDSLIKPGHDQLVEQKIDNWVQVNLKQGANLQNQKEKEVLTKKVESESGSFFDLSDLNKNLYSDPGEKKEGSISNENPIELTGKTTRPESVKDEVTQLKIENNPVVTLTLVDLYVKQKLHSKALIILEKMLDLNKKDLRIIKKIDEVRKLIANNEVVGEIQDIQNSNDSPPKSDQLMVEYDKQMQKMDKKKKILSEKFNLFIHYLRERSAEIKLIST